MSDGRPGHVSVDERIPAPAATIFGVLADPQAHVELDGSGMVRATTARPINGVGDVFTMAMHFPALGDYEMDNHVVESSRPLHRLGTGTRTRPPGGGLRRPVGASLALRAGAGRSRRDGGHRTETSDFSRSRRPSAPPTAGGHGSTRWPPPSPASRSAVAEGARIDVGATPSVASAQHEPKGVSKWHSITRRRRCWRSWPRAGGKPLHESTPEEAREPRRPASPRCPDRARRMARVEDITVAAADGHAIPVRVLVPQQERPRGDRLLHGGGWVIGAIDEYDTLGRKLAERTVVRRRARRLPPRPRAPLPDGRRRLLGRARVGRRAPRRHRRRPTCR